MLAVERLALQAMHPPGPSGHDPTEEGRTKDGPPESTAAPLSEAPKLAGWDQFVSGVVRELYVPAGIAASAAQEVLVVAPDRISAYDHALQPGIPDKGRLLTGISLFWFEQLADI